jgi:hypothetical protein
MAYLTRAENLKSTYHALAQGVIILTSIMASPDSVLSHTDPGDDMQRRLKYQAA